MFRPVRAARAGLAAFAALIALLGSSPAAAADCDRACLGGLITQYVDAMLVHDPSTLPLAEGARFTENSQKLELGEGLWKSVTGKAGFRQDYLDTGKQVAAAHIELREGDIPVLLALVLHVEDRRIAGIETLYERILPDSRWQPTELGGPIRGMNDPVPEGKRQDRASMIATALTYTEGLRVGNFSDGGTPFAPETYRVENGFITAGVGCTRPDCGMYEQRIMLHPGVIASVAAVDEEAGIVLLWMNFGYNDVYEPNTALVTYEAFKVWGGEIHSINAFFTMLPVSAPRYWNSADPVR